ncbi:unnamed protein product, partial [Amoebophrya sp. A120]
ELHVEWELPNKINPNYLPLLKYHIYIDNVLEHVIEDTGVTSYTLWNCKNGKVYDIVVHAVNAAGESRKEGEIITVVAGDVPQKPATPTRWERVNATAMVVGWAA